LFELEHELDPTATRRKMAGQARELEDELMEAR